MVLDENKKSRSTTSTISTVDDNTEIIDFDDFRRATNNDIQEKAAEIESVLDSNSTPSKEEIFDWNAIDPTRRFQYPMISQTKPPGGIPLECQKLLLSQSHWYQRLRSSFLLSERPIVQCDVVRGFLGLHQDRVYHLKTHPYIIHPYSDFYTGWIYVTTFILALSVAYEPYVIAFECEEYVQNPTRSLSLLVSVMLLVDMAMKFIVGDQNKYSLVINLEPEAIAKAYLNGWFIYDLLTRFPFDSILIYQMSEEDLTTRTKLEAVRLIAFFTKIFRYKTVYHVLARAADTFSFESLLTPWLLKLTILIFYTIHWHACFHWLLPSIVNAYYETPKKMSWVTDLGCWDKHEFVQYINAYLKSLSNLLTLDGGNFIPREVEEIFCTIIGIMLSVGMYGYFISSFSALSSELYASEEQFNVMIDLFEEYLKFQEIPDNLQQKVFGYFEKKYHGHIFSESLILATLSPSLRGEVACHNCRNLVEKVGLFKTLPPGVILDIILRLVFEVYVPGDVIVSPDIPANCMFFVQDGELEVLTSYGERVAYLMDGDFFGEANLLTNEPRTHSVVALAPCEVYMLSRENFRECVEAYPEVYDEILNMARERLTAEILGAQEAAREAEADRKWKKTKIDLDYIVEQENKFQIDESGVQLVDDVKNEDEEVEMEDNDPQDEDEESGQTNASSLKTEIAQGQETAVKGSQHQVGFLKSPLKNVKKMFKHLKK